LVFGITSGLPSMVIRFGLRATEVDMSLGLLWAVVIVTASILVEMEN